MLLFRSEEHIENWCRAWKLPRGAILSVEQAWKLADAWYRDRMSPHWRRRTTDETHKLFHSLGLTSEFWHLA
jgi:hypothetical protein